VNADGSSGASCRAPERDDFSLNRASAQHRRRFAAGAGLTRKSKAITFYWPRATRRNGPRWRICLIFARLFGLWLENIEAVKVVVPEMESKVMG